LLEVLPSDMRRGSRSRVGYSPSTPPPVETGHDEPIETASPLGWLSPGQVVRMPVGYLLIAAAGVLILVVAVFYVGYETGGRAEKVEAERRLREYGAPTNDPLVEGFVDPVGSAADIPGAGGAEPGSDTTRQAQPTETAGRDEPDDAQSRQPAERRRTAAPATPERVKGLNYWIVSYTTPEEGERLVDFFAEHGIPAKAYPASGGNVQVWVLRGFSREELRTNAADEFKLRLRRLGRIWKSERGGTDDLDTMWLNKY
jgi:hypothetical protein